MYTQDKFYRRTWAFKLYKVKRQITEVEGPNHWGLQDLKHKIYSQHLSTWGRPVCINTVIHPVILKVYVAIMKL